MTTWCGVSAMRRPSGNLPACVALPQTIGSTVGAGLMYLASHDAMSVASPGSYVEMIMKANSPASREQLGRALGVVPGADDAATQGMSVMSKVRSRPGGVMLVC